MKLDTLTSCSTPQSTDLQYCFLQPVVDQLGVALLLLQFLLQLSNTSFQPSPLLSNLSATSRRKVGR